MSIAWYSAWRTRLSLNGFLPLTFEYRSSSRRLVHAEEHDPVLDALDHLDAGRLRQARHVLRRRVVDEVDLAGDQRGDARRVGDDRRVDDLVDVAVEAPVLRCPTSSGSSPARSSRPARATSAMYGPVPFACRAVIMSSLFVKFCGFVARFFSHHALLMMLIVADVLELDRVRARR